jgi:hypothetical protein
MTWHPAYLCSFRIDLIGDGAYLGWVWRIKRGEYRPGTVEPLRRLPNERTVTAAKRAVETAVMAMRKAA